MLGDQRFGSVEILNRTHTSTSLSAAGARTAANVEVALWMRVESHVQQLDMEGSKLPRIRRPPVKADEGSEPDHFSSPIDLHRQMCCQVVDIQPKQITNKILTTEFCQLSSLGAFTTSVSIE